MMESDRKVLVRTPTARSSQEAIQAALDARDFDTFKLELQWGGSGRVFWAALMSGIREQLKTKGIALASQSDFTEEELALFQNGVRKSSTTSFTDKADKQPPPLAPSLSRAPRSLAAPLPPLETAVAATVPPLAPVASAIEQPLRNATVAPPLGTSEESPLAGTLPGETPADGAAPSVQPSTGTGPYSASAKKHFASWD